MKKFFIGLITSIALSLLVAKYIQAYFDSLYGTGGSLASISFPNNIDGFLFSYVFFSSFVISVLSKKIKTGLYSVLPVITFDIIIGSFNPQLRLDLILLAVGLGLAYLILNLKNKT